MAHGTCSGERDGEFAEYLMKVEGREGRRGFNSRSILVIESLWSFN